MKHALPILSAASLLSFSLPAIAFECTNAGAGTTPPNDNGVGSQTACGEGANAFGSGSTALGAFASSAGASSTSLGGGASSSGDSSTALGTGAASAGSSSTALGRSASAAGDFSAAFGRSARSVGNGSVAVGYFAFSSGASGTTLGLEASAAGANSTAIGARATAPNDNTLVLGSIPGENFATDYVDVAVGTVAPLAPLHVFRDDDTREFLFLESDETGVTQDRPMMFLANNGGIRFEFENSALSTAWRFQAATGNQDRFEVTKVGTGQIEFWIDALGNGFIAGDLDVGGSLLTDVLLPSDRDLKTRVHAIDPETVLDRVASLPVNAWEYTDRPGERHIGPMAQDFQAAFGLGRDETSISVVDASGVALASIQALARRNQSLEARNRALEARVEELESLRSQNTAFGERLALLEALVMDTRPRMAED